MDISKLAKALEFFPDTISELEVEPDVTVRLKSLEAEVSAFRTGPPLDTTASRKLSEFFKLQHIYNSTGIEGNRLSLRETEVVLLEGLELGDKPLSDQLEVKDLGAAFRFLEECAQPDAPVREIDVRELHRLAVCQSPEAHPGAYRNTGVVISGSDFTPPEPLAVPGLMQQLIQWVNTTTKLDPLSFAAVAHHKLAAIHPFSDGNGRVARLLLNLTLMKAGYPVVNIRREDRPLYYEALTYADVGLYSPLVSLSLDRALEVFNHMKRVRDETERMKVWAANLGQKEAEVAQKREEREYRIWLSTFETVKLEFQSRADILGDSLDGVQVNFKAYPPPDFSKYILLGDKGKAPQSWFFSIGFRGKDRTAASHFFFFRFFREYRSHPGSSKLIPLQLNWFVNDEDCPVDSPAISLRELWVEKDRGLIAKRLNAGRLDTGPMNSSAPIAEQFFQDVLKGCFGIG